jgi:hypothetical protein
MISCIRVPYEGWLDFSQTHCGDKSASKYWYVVIYSAASFVFFQDLFPSMAKVYDCEIKEPNDRDRNIYERYT